MSVKNEETESDKFVEDPRYRQCNKESLMGLGLGVLNLLWWFLWGYGLGSAPVENYNYVLGFPLWFFMSCIVGAPLFTVLAVIMVKYFYKEMPLGELTAAEVEAMKEGRWQ